MHSRARDWNGWKNFGRANTRSQLSSGWISIGSELSSLNSNSSVGAEQSFAICYPGVVIKFLRSNLDICLSYFVSFGREILFACFRSQTATEIWFFKLRFFVALLNGFRFRGRNPFQSRKAEHAKAPSVHWITSNTDPNWAMFSLSERTTHRAGSWNH